MEKAGGLLKNDKIAEKGHQKREQAAYGDNSGSYGSGNTDSYGSSNNNNNDY
jgi:hypothetical protein